MLTPATAFEPSRSGALARLRQFVPLAGRRYATERNIDFGSEDPGAVSRLSPYLRYRLLTESEVVGAVLDQHSFVAAEKFVQEVLWRTYWKGWLEMRPSVWTRFVQERERERNDLFDTRALLTAEDGTTGIEGFDDWARELVETGYLHNHARMWFASIWIFTLRLPWQLGADFFLRHLLDADAASNTLSWRWVAGLQTVGKTYLATTDNIARYTNGRFAPVGLATEATPLTEPPISPAQVLPDRPRPQVGKGSILLVTTEDMHPETLPLEGIVIKASIVAADGDLLWGDKARMFAGSFTADATSRVGTHFGCPTGVAKTLDCDTLLAAAQLADVKQIVTAYAPVGPVAEALSELSGTLASHGVALTQIRRPWDECFWPHAKKGFFPFRERIETLLREQGLQ